LFTSGGLAGKIVFGALREGGDYWKWVGVFVGAVPDTTSVSLLAWGGAERASSA